MSFAVLASLLATPGVGRAQFETASVLGYVRDSTGAAVVHGTVSLINTQTGQNIAVQTDAQGEYNFRTSRSANTKSTRPRQDSVKPRQKRLPWP